MNTSLNWDDKQQRFPSTKKNMSLRCMLALMLCVALSAPFGLVGCSGGSAEDAINASLTSELDRAKSLDSGFISSIAPYMDVDLFRDYGIDGTEFVTEYFDGFDYTIDSINVDDNEATAVVTLTCTSYSDFYSRLNAASSTMAQNASDYVDMSREDLSRVYGTLLMDTLSDVDLAQTKPMTLTFKRTDNTWKMQESLEGAIASSLLTN